MRVVVDRDSVAMGDDMQSHRREFEFGGGVTLGKLLRKIRPDATIAGGLATWLVIVGPPAAGQSVVGPSVVGQSVVGPPAGRGSKPSAPVAVYAQEWSGARFLTDPGKPLSELAGGGDVLTVHFSYLTQVDPEIAFGRYQAGGTLSASERSQLSGQRIAQVAESNAKRDERRSKARYLSPAAVEAVERFGFVVRAHSARYFGGEMQTADGALNVLVQAQDTMAGVSVNGRHLAYFRPILHAEQFLVVQLGDAWLADVGRPPVELPAPASGTGVPATMKGHHWFVEYDEGAVQHNATFGTQEELARRFAGYAPLALPVIVAAYQA